MTPIEERAVKALRTDGPMRASDLGQILWGSRRNSGGGSHAHNRFCRPAGRLLKRLERQGLVLGYPTAHCWLWASLK